MYSRQHGIRRNRDKFLFALLCLAEGGELRAAPALMSALSGAPSSSTVPLLVTRGDRGRSYLRSTADLRLSLGSDTLPFRELCRRRHAR